jgi:acyl-[acyl-carrier-protein]-phospholipid O-acyltransferase/long-chain-fatty-acid--[acyl-carrier-protein] ligase
MTLAAIFVIALLAWLAAAGWLVVRFGVDFRQALLYAPLKALHRIDDSRISTARQAPTPVIYVVTHRSRFDPALMLALLPSETLHILDKDAAQSWQLEPFRVLARAIAFNTEHVFISRRLVRHLRGEGRLAVYIPENVEPGAKAFRLYRAIARIAVEAEATIAPIFVDGYQSKPQAVWADSAPRNLFSKLTISALPARSIAELIAEPGVYKPSAANALFDRVAEARFAATDLTCPLFDAALEAANRHGQSRTIVEDVITGSLTYRRLFIAARVLGKKIIDRSEGETVGILLPNANGVVIALLGLWSAGRAAAMLNYTAGPANIATACRTAVVRTVVSSRAFIEKAGLQDLVAAIETAGCGILWLEDLRDSVTTLDKASGALNWRRPLGARSAEKPAVVLFTSGSEGAPKAVVLSHRNLLANAKQVDARIALSPDDKLLNVLPVFHSYGLTGGTILPLIAGVHTVFYPSPLHYKIIPELAKKVRPTIMFATDTFLSAYARTADDEDFASLRLVVAGAEPLRAETRKVWKDRFDADIVEGYGMTEASPVVAVNSATHGRAGTVGRLLPGVRIRLEPVDGIDEAGRLWVGGPNVMLGYMTADRPGILQPLSGMHDSGDIVAIDREGFLTIRGRAKRFAKIAGEMVSLAAVEQLAQAVWPDARHAVVAVPDKRRGERIVLVTAEDAADQETLRQHAKKVGAAEIMLPNDILKVEDVPTLGTGKIDHVATRRLAMQRLGLERAA